jgi:adenylyltransferase/sulfurtransferase
MEPVPEITVEELKKKMDRKENFLLLDVREPGEYQTAKIAGSTLIPLKTLPGRLTELKKDQEIVVHCHHGGRSYQACQFLRAQGYNAVNVEDGIQAWSERIDSSVPTY